MDDSSPPSYETTSTPSSSTSIINLNPPLGDVKQPEGPPDLPEQVPIYSNERSDFNSGIEFLVRKGKGDFFRNDIITLVDDEVVQYYLEIPAPHSSNRWDLKLRKGSDEGEIIIITSSTRSNDVEIIFASSSSTNEVDGITINNNESRILKQKGLFKKYWELISFDNNVWNWESNDRIVKGGSVLINKSKETVAIWNSTKLSPTNTGRLSIYPNHGKDVELILTSALILEEISKRKPDSRVDAFTAGLVAVSGGAAGTY